MNQKIAMVFVMTLAIIFSGFAICVAESNQNSSAISTPNIGKPISLVSPSEGPRALGNNSMSEIGTGLIGPSKKPVPADIAELLKTPPKLIPNPSSTSAKPTELPQGRGQIAKNQTKTAVSRVTTPVLGNLLIWIWYNGQWTLDDSAFIFGTNTGLGWWSSVPQMITITDYANGQIIFSGSVPAGYGEPIQWSPDLPVNAWHLVAVSGDVTGHSNPLWVYIYSSAQPLQFQINPPTSTPTPGLISISYTVNQACDAQFMIGKPGDSLGPYSASTPGLGTYQVTYNDPGPAGNRVVVGIARTATDVMADAKDYTVT